MAISSFQQRIVHSIRPNRVRLVSLALFLGSLASATLAGPVWASDSTPSLQDSQVQTATTLQGTDAAPIATPETAVFSKASWQIEIAYVASEASSGISQE